MHASRVTGVWRLLGSAVAALSLGLMPEVANADEGVSQYCTANDDFGFTHGACVAANQTRNFVPGVADLCRDEAVRALYGATSHGECVRIGIRLFPGGPE